MITIGDALKILDKIPIWKTIKQLCMRVEALEEEIKKLKVLLDKKEIGKRCPECKSHQVFIDPTIFSDSDPDSINFGLKKIKFRHWVCDKCEAVMRQYINKKTQKFDSDFFS